MITPSESEPVANFQPHVLYGGCAHDPNPELSCQLIVNTTLYPPLILQMGPKWEQSMSRGAQWFTFILSVVMSVWFVYNLYTGHCGWEVIFVTIIECKPPGPAPIHPAPLPWNFSKANERNAQPYVRGYTVTVRALRTSACRRRHRPSLAIDPPNP